MLPSWKRRSPLPLPATATPQTSTSSTGNYSTPYARAHAYRDKDKDEVKDRGRLRLLWIRARRALPTRRDRTAAALFLLVVAGLSLAVVLRWTSPIASHRTRATEGSRVVARDWTHGETRVSRGAPGGALVDEQGVAAPAQMYNQTVLVRPSLHTPTLSSPVR